MSDCNLTSVIQDTECIGASLVKINNNFTNLDELTCSLQATLNALLAGTASSSANIRLSLSNQTPYPSTSITGSSIFLHAVNGNTVSLWDQLANKWVVRTVPNVTQFSLNGLAANTNYDIYLYWDGSGLRLEFVTWGNNDVGAAPPETGKQDGVLVKPGTPSKRLIGCLRTTSANTTEVSLGRTAVLGGSHPKIFLHNIYNQVPISFSILDIGPSQNPGGIKYWQTTASGDNAGNAPNGPFEMFGSSANNRVSFITRATQTATLNTVTYLLDAICTYFGFSIDIATPMVSDITSRGTPIWEGCAAGPLTQTWNNTIGSGYHFVQVVSMTYANQLQRYLTWTGDRHSYGTFGSLAAY
jgi:hypothetical protein